MPLELDALHCLPQTWDGQRWDGVACDVSPAPVEGRMVAGGDCWLVTGGWHGAGGTPASRVYARQDWMMDSVEYTQDSN